MSETIFDVIFKMATPGALLDGDNPKLLAHQDRISMSTPSMFWRPSYFAKSAWIEHVPFAFWMIENMRPATVVELGTHYGVSYFSFCQAVQRLGLNTRCFAVDTWKGDEHAGMYDESVYQQVNQYNEVQYSDFSRLVRSTFDKALKHFEDGSIDLLHIDGLHTLDEVTHDFESWLPKLSDRAVVLMHDTNVRERGFGVFKLFSQLKKRYPYFEFSHGHGLGVLGVGENQAEALVSLYSAGGNTALQRSLCEMFGRLGRACADTRDLLQAEKFSRALTVEAEGQKRQIDDLLAQSKMQHDELSSKEKCIVELSAKNSFLADKASLEREHLVEQISHLKNTESQLKVLLEETRANISTATEDLDRQKEAQLEVRRACDELSNKLRLVDQECISLKLERDEDKQKIVELHLKLKEHESVKREQLAEIQQLRQGLGGGQKSDSEASSYGVLQERLNEIVQLTQLLKNKELESTLAIKRSQSLESQMNEVASKLQQKDLIISDQKSLIISLEEKIETQKKSLCLLSHQVDELYNSRSWRITSPLRRIKILFAHLAKPVKK